MTFEYSDSYMKTKLRLNEPLGVITVLPALRLMFLILHVTSWESNSSCTAEGWLGPSMGVDQTLIKIRMCRCMAVYVPVPERVCEKEWEGICLQMCWLSIMTAIKSSKWDKKRNKSRFWISGSCAKYIEDLFILNISSIKIRLCIAEIRSDIRHLIKNTWYVL